MTSTASTRAKQPFEAIQEAEEHATLLLEKEEERMKKEYSAAKERHAREEEGKKQQFTADAMKELKTSKETLSVRLDEAMQDAEREAQILEKRARGKMPALTVQLMEDFFSTVI